MVTTRVEQSIAGLERVRGELNYIIDTARRLFKTRNEKPCSSSTS